MADEVNEFAESDDGGSLEHVELVERLTKSELPDLKTSSGVIMYEAGRQVGLRESRASVIRSMRLWQSAAAAATILALATTAGWWSEGAGPDTIKATAQAQTDSVDPSQRDNAKTTDSPGSETRGPNLASGTHAISVPSVRKPNSFFFTPGESNLDPASALALRRYVVQRGVDYLPEPAQYGLALPDSRLNSYQLMNQFLQSGEF